MSDLLHDYFKRDLSEAEEDRLAEELSSSESSSSAFLKQAQAYYEKTLVNAPQTPFWKKPLFAFWGGVSATTLCFLLFLFVMGRGGNGSKPVPSLETKAAVISAPKTQSVAKTHLRQKVELTLPASSKPQAWQQGHTYSVWNVVIHQTANCLITIRVLDASGREVKALYAGFLKPGAWVFEWNGRDKAGRRVADGPYTIEAQSGKQTARKAINVGNTAP